MGDGVYGDVNIIEPENDFERNVVSLCAEMADMLITKNRVYQNSFSDSRTDTLKLFGSDRIPFYMHAIEKIKRYTSVNNTEDSVMDLAGYCCLEIICSRSSLYSVIEQSSSSDKNYK